MSIYEILPALYLTQSVHAKISIGMHRGVKFKIFRIPLIGLETRLGWRTDRTFLRNPNLNEINQGGCRAKWNNCIPQDIDISCRYDNDPRWFPQALYVTESHHIVLIKCSLLNRTTLTFVLKLSPLQVTKFDVCAQYK
jgi:hypothetical protein